MKFAFVVTKVRLSMRPNLMTDALNILVEPNQGHEHLMNYICTDNDTVTRQSNIHVRSKYIYI